MPGQVAIINRTQPQSEPLPARFCDSFLCRLRGLMFRRSIPTGWGLLLVERRDSRLDTAIHMFFVPFDLAVVWINTAGRVVDVKLARSWRPFYAPRLPARYTLEMAAGHLHDFAIGDEIVIQPLP
jgi:uncharacterized membrane protein (UPF0127 family)